MIGALHDDHLASEENPLHGSGVPRFLLGQELEICRHDI